MSGSLAQAMAIQFRMPAGIPGVANRLHDATIEAQILDAALPPLHYGTGVVMDAATGQIRAPNATDTAASVYGLFVRPYPTQAGQDPLGTDTPPVSGVCNILKRGYMTVKLLGATAAVKGAPVHLGIAASGGGNIAGGITADAPAAGTIIALTNAYFMGAADPAGNTEIAYNL